MARAKKKRYWNSPHHRIKDLISGAIYKATKKHQAVKSNHSLELLGCTIEFFRSRLESKFRDGMNWSNQGRFGWHIDHIRPCASFDLKNSKDQEMCFHYTNLQPLWWRDNLKKGDKFLCEV